MSKRNIKDPLTKIELEVKRTPQPRRGTGRNAKSKNFYQRNYLDVFKIITPNVYWEDDIALSGTSVSELDQLLNSHILTTSIDGGVMVSSLASISHLSALNTVSGMAQFYVKQNNLTWITPQQFEDKILKPLSDKGVANSKLADYTTSDSFKSFISGTFLPNTHLQKSSGKQVSVDLATNSLSAYDDTPSGTHKYYIDNLSWLYFLNTADLAIPRTSGFTTSGELAQLYTDTIYRGKTITLEDCMKLFQKHIWEGYAALSATYPNSLPEKYRTPDPSNTYTSGTQLRDRLETLAGVLYSDNHFNDKDTKVETAFTDYANTTTFITDEEEAGPFTKFLKGISFSFADRSGEIDELETLLDIEECPDEYLDYLADLIGWKLIGPDASRRRNQIRQAVAVYKAKGTRRSVQYVADAVFGTSALDVTTNQIYDLWESYLPNLIYFALLTKSTLTENGLKSFTEKAATDLGLDSYSKTNLEHNVKLAVDRIMWELIVEFPDNFTLAGKPFSRTKLYYADALTRLPNGGAIARPNVLAPYPEGQEYIQYPNGFYFEYPGPNESGGNASAAPIWNAQGTSITNWDLAGRQILALGADDPTFEFNYRGRTVPFPNWEDIKYYKQSAITESLLDSLYYKLICFGVPSDFSLTLINYVKNNTSRKSDVDYITNSMLFFTDVEKYPPNYADIISVKNPEGNELIKYIPFWNSKSSHFKIRMSASSFDFTNPEYGAGTSYALTKLRTLVDTAAPAHAIPEILVDVSAMDDSRISLSAVACPKAILPLSSVAVYDSAASATILTNFAVSTVDPTQVLPASKVKKFRRSDASGLNNPIFASGSQGVSDTVFFSSAPRNAIRRRNRKFLLNYEEVDLRDGIGSPGMDFLYKENQYSSIYGTGSTGKDNLVASGVMSLGFKASSLAFENIDLKREPFGFGNLIDTSAFPGVWEICQNYLSSDVFYDITTSDTFPHRGFVSPESGECSAFFSRRGPLNELMSLMHKVSYYEKKLEASSLVSGYYLSGGEVNPDWPVSSSKIEPAFFSSWYEYGFRDVVTSLANQLEEAEIAEENTNYYDDFKFGEQLNRLYRDWLQNYGRQTLNFNYTKSADYNPNILTHIFGPYLFNSDFEITASALDSNPELITSSLSSLVDISWGGGNGILSPNNIYSINNYTASDLTDMYVFSPEIRNDALLSGVELVDASTIYDAFNRPTQSPTFSVLRIDEVRNIPQTQAVQPQDHNRALEDNTVLRHTRNFDERLPRIRYKIDARGVTSRSDFSNKLVPNCDYTLSVKSGSYNIGDHQFASNTLKAWIHTEPITHLYRDSQGNYNKITSVWTYDGRNWVRTTVGDTIATSPSVLGKQQGLYYVLQNSLAAQYSDSTTATETITTNVPLVTPAADLLTPEQYPPFKPRQTCTDDTFTLIQSTQSNIRETTFDTLEFKFNTSNKLVQDPPNETSLHTNNRVYYIELFLEQADPNKYIIVDSVEMVNDTLKAKAKIETDFGDYTLDRKDLRTCLDYFSKMSTSNLASRNSTITSGTLEVSGGSRISYRDNVNRSIPTWDSTYKQIESIIIRGN